MHTHLEQWTADTAAPGEQLGVRCLAQGSHLSRGLFLPEPRFEPTTSGYKSDALSIGATTAHKMSTVVGLKPTTFESPHPAVKKSNALSIMPQSHTSDLKCWCGGEGGCWMCFFKPATELIQIVCQLLILHSAGGWCLVVGDFFQKFPH